MSVPNTESFKAIIARQPRFHLILLGSLGLAVLGSSFIKVNKRGLLLHDAPAALLVNDSGGPLPVRFAQGYGGGPIVQYVAPAGASPVTRVADAIPIDTLETTGNGGGGSPATRFIAPRGSTALAAGPTAGSSRSAGLPGIANSGFMLSPAGPFLASDGSGGGTDNGGGGTDNGGGSTDNGGGSTDNGGGSTDNGGGSTDNGGGSTDNGGGSTDNGGGSTDNGGGSTDNGGGSTDNGGGSTDNGGGSTDPGTGGGGGSDPVDTGGGDAPAVPEPAAWLMMIIGVGALGRMLRRQGDMQAQMVPARIGTR